MNEPRTPKLRRPADTVDVQTDETFEGALARETHRSERLRLSIVASIIGIVFVGRLMGWLFFHQPSDEPTTSPVDDQVVTAIWGLALVAELFALYLANRALRLGHGPSIGLRYVNAFVETSIPTLALVLGIETSSPDHLLLQPVSWGYFLFIILAALHLDFGLCAFTGLVAAIEHTWVAVYFLGQPLAGPINPSVSEPLSQAMRIVLLIGAGLLAGVVSLQIRRQFATALRSVQDRNRVVSMFGQHVSPAVVKQLLSQDVELGGELRDVCVMFLDIQGFTAFAESRRPEEVVAYLNRLFGVMIEIVNRHHGIINKFLGDGFMAVFGAPISDGEDCHNAVAAARELVEQIERRSADGTIPPTRIRIGLHVGEAVTGNVGSAERKEYTVIGDVVNLASRLEQLNKQFGSRLLVSDATFDQLEGHRAWATALGEVEVKGRQQPIQVYQLA